jgi:hypothetical protein
VNASAKRAFCAFGAVTAFVVVAGAVFLAMTMVAAFHHFSDLNDAAGPYTAQFFGIFSFANLVFLGLLSLAAVRLFRMEYRGVALLALTLKCELVYFFLGALFWLIPAPIGMSAGRATGIGNMGISPQIIIAYPITGLIAIWILRRLGILKVEPGASCGRDKHPERNE